MESKFLNNTLRLKLDWEDQHKYPSRCIFIFEFTDWNLHSFAIVESEPFFLDLNMHFLESMSMFTFLWAEATKVSNYND